MKNPDAIVIGAGIVGAACGYALTKAGLRVLILDRGSIASGTTSAGEGNILVSDKEPGPELTLALRSRELWFELNKEIGDTFELEAKGGVVVARHDDRALMKLASLQTSNGVTAIKLNSTELHNLEPYLHPDISRGVFYPQDSQCQPMLATAHLIRAVIAGGGEFKPHSLVTAITSQEGRISGVKTTNEEFSTPIVVNATGTWAADLAALAGSSLPIAPRRGFILVTTPVPKYVFHKVYDSDYVSNVSNSDAKLQTSTVVEGTRSGTILIGASRERVGFNREVNMDVLRKLAAQATSLFPILRNVELLRFYSGFRPYAPDHIPIIGEDPILPGLWHSAGHEGAGIGLAPGSALLIAQQITGQITFMDAQPFSPSRFHNGAA